MVDPNRSDLRTRARRAWTRAVSVPFLLVPMILVFAALAQSVASETPVATQAPLYRNLSDEELAARGLQRTAIAGVFQILPPPANFNPMTATDADLRRYGFPKRPVDLRSAEYHTWERTFSNPLLHFVNKPPLAGPNLRSLKTKTRLTYGPYTSNSSWSGIVSGTVTANQPSNIVPYGDQRAISTLYATMACPNVDGTPVAELQIYAVAEWIGIDGYDDLVDQDGLIQSGITATHQCAYYVPNSGGLGCTPGPGVNCVASCQASYNLFGMVIPNRQAANYLSDISQFTSAITVNPGDIVLVQISPISAAAQEYFFVDLNSNQFDAEYIEVDTTANPMTINYGVADWIVENPEVQVWGATQASHMAHYGTTFMWNAHATAAVDPAAWLYPGTGGALLPLYITDANGNTLSSVSTLGQETLMFFQPYQP